MSLQAANAAPAETFSAIVPSDSADMAVKPRAIYVGVQGDIVMHNEAGAAITFKAVPGGTVLPVQTKRVMVTGTTATFMVALF